MEEDIIKPSNTPEPHVSFKVESERDIYEVRSPKTDEPLIQITGYGVQMRFNRKYLQTIEDIEAALNGLSSLFRGLIVEQVLVGSKPLTEG